MFKKDDEEDDMDDDSVVFTDSSSSDHPPLRLTFTITNNLNNGRFQSNNNFIFRFNIIFKYGF